MHIHQVLLVILAPLLGSFSTVLYSRGLTGQSIFFPSRSFCDNCKATLSWKHNLPIISFLQSRGRCAICKAKIDYNIFIIEIVTSLLIIMVSVYSTNKMASVFLTIIAVVTLPLIVIDILIKRIPNTLTLLFLGSILISFGIGMMVGEIRIATFLDCIGVATLITFAYLLIYLISRGGIGFGDVKLSFPIACLCSYFSWQQGIVAVLMAFFIGGAYGIFQIVFFNKSRKYQVPFAPFMLFGAWFSIVAGSGTAKIILKFWSL